MSEMMAETKNLEAVAIVKMFMECMYRNGDWDDGCFYYNRYAASEFREPIRRAETLLAAAPTQVGAA